MSIIVFKRMSALQALVIMMGWSVLALPTFAESAPENWLSVSPGRCVALRQGQTCHQSLKFRWQVRHPGKYCLQRVGSAKPEVCWSNTELSQHKVKFEADSSTEFLLVKLSSNEVLSRVTVEVAWVYKSSRSRSGWRIF